MDVEKSPLLVEVVDGEGGMIVGRNKSRGRGRVLARGAAALIDKWPDNLSSCWLTTLILSLSFVGVCIAVNAFAQRPLDLRIEEHTTPLAIVIDKDITELQRPSTHPRMFRRENKIYEEEIYCHLIVNPLNMFPINKYLKYISLLSSEYPSHRFTIYVFSNDTVKYLYHNEVSILSRELIESDVHDRLRKKYDLQLKEEIVRFSTKYDNVKFIQMKLSEYFEGSPIKRTWFRVSPNIVPFLTRAVSLWENGGICLNLEALIIDRASNKENEDVYELLNSYLSIEKNKQSKKQEQRSTRGEKHRISKRSNPVMFYQESLLYKVPIRSEFMFLYIVSNTSNIIGNKLSSSPISSASTLALSLNDKNKKIQQPWLVNNYYNRHPELPLLKRKVPSSYHFKKRDIISTFTERIDGTVLTLSRKGDFIATKAHCHALLAQIFSCLQGKTSHQSSEELIYEALSIFCNLASPSQFKKCPGIRLLA